MTHQQATAHLILESLAYCVGMQLWWRARRISTLPRPDTLQGLGILAGAICGGAMGSKLLYCLQYVDLLARLDFPLPLMLGGKTVVGGLLGGILGVEIAKRLVGWTPSTGDQIWLPLAIGMIIGRIGCQSAGLGDLTYGNPTSLPWGWQYEDGIVRHPTPLYEIIVLFALIPTLSRQQARRPAGATFRLFICSYLLFRFLVEFLKPPFGPAAAATFAPLRPGLWGPFTAIQWAALAGMLAYFPSLWALHTQRPSHG